MTTPENSKQDKRFTILLSINTNCSKCDNTATSILLGKDRELLGFFCQEHGEVSYSAFENKYRFEDEKKVIQAECLHCKKLFYRRVATHQYCSFRCKRLSAKKRNPNKKYKKKVRTPKEFCRLCQEVFSITYKNREICAKCYQPLPELEESVMAIQEKDITSRDIVLLFTYL